MTMAQEEPLKTKKNKQDKAENGKDKDTGGTENLRKFLIISSESSHVSGRLIKVGNFIGRGILCRTQEQVHVGGTHSHPYGNN